MSGNQLATVTDTIEKTKKAPPLWHYYCRCQMQQPPGVKRARCGAKLAGWRANRAAVAPVDTCVICIDLEQSKQPCQFCGLEIV
jgi:hypothetical protein